MISDLGTQRNLNLKLLIGKVKKQPIVHCWIPISWEPRPPGIPAKEGTNEEGFAESCLQSTLSPLSLYEPGDFPSPIPTETEGWLSRARLDWGQQVHPKDVSTILKTKRWNARTLVARIWPSSRVSEESLLGNLTSRPKDIETSGPANKRAQHRRLRPDNPQPYAERF